MRKIVVMAVMLACVLVVPSAYAAKGDITFGLNGGLTIPTGDFGKTDTTSGQFGFKSGFTGGVFGDYMVHEMIAVGIDAGYGQNKGKDLPSGVDAKLTIINVGAHVKYMPPMKDMPISPYLQVGAGLYNAKAKITFGSESSDTTVNKFGFNVGIGADYKVTPQVGVGIYGTYHSIMKVPLGVDAEGNDVEKTANYIAAGVRVTFLTGGGAKK